MHQFPWRRWYRLEARLASKYRAVSGTKKVHRSIFQLRPYIGRQTGFARWARRYRHYKEQLRLVDVLVDRIRILGGARQIFASSFLQGKQFACALRGSKAAGDLLSALLDAHESVLNTGRPNGSASHEQWAHDFALGQVVLTNDLQGAAISDQLAGCESRQSFLSRYAGAVLDSE
jgi:hypothetical protein